MVPRSDVTASPRTFGGNREEPHRLTDIQGLRAIAILFVVAFHAGLPVPGGFVGVDVFFVISGFVITSVLIREHVRSGRVDLGQFYARRFKRLIPALALMVSVTLMIAAVVLAPTGPQRTTAETAIGAMFLAANLVIHRNTGDYFDLDAELNPLLHTWTLSLEEQFYLVFPPILIVGFLMAARRRHAASAPLILTAAVLGISLLAAFGLLAIPALPDSLGGFYGPATRAWEFAAGALLAFVGTGLKKRLRSAGTSTAAGAIGAVMLGASLWVIGPDTPFPGPVTLLPVTGTVLLILAGLSGARGVTRALSTRPLVSIGDLSYSWYLWHWPLIVFATVLWPGRPVVPLAAAAVSLAPAILSYRLVEQPLRSLAGIPPTRFARLVLTTLMTPVALATSVWFAASQGYWSESIRQYQASVTSKHSLAFPDCDDGSPSEGCRFNTTSTLEPIYLIGDSHAQQFAEAVVGAAEQLDRPTTALVQPGCEFLPSCPEGFEPRMTLLERSAAGTVIIANRNYESDMPADGSSAATRSPQDLAPARGLITSIQRLQAAGHDVLIVQTVPQHPRPPSLDGFDPDWCTMIEVLSDACQTATSEDLARLQQPGARELVLASAQATGASILDPWPVLCSDGLCPSSSPDGPVYRSHSHITVDASRSLAPVFVSKLKP